MNPAPKQEAPKPVAPQAPVRPQAPAPQAPPPVQQTNPEFPSWLPAPKPNIQRPEMPTLPDITSNDPAKKNDFNYQHGKQSAACPKTDSPNHPLHLPHESDCKKFYKCFNGRSFMMECPSGQEWSDNLQRCDYHEIANCDPIELIKKRIHV